MGNPHSRLRRFESGHTVSLPLDVEFRSDGSRLPATIPAGLNGRARVSCSKDRGLIKVRGGGMVPGFDDEFWNTLTQTARDGSIKSLEQDGEVLLAVPMKYPPNGGILVALAQEDWAILQLGAPAEPGSLATVLTASSRSTVSPVGSLAAEHDSVHPRPSGEGWVGIRLSLG